MTSPMTNSTAPGTSEKSSTSTPANTLNAAGPWIRPELNRSPDYVFENLRETKHMINSLQEREKRLKAEVAQLHEQGKLDHLVDRLTTRKSSTEMACRSALSRDKKNAFTNRRYRWRSTPSKRRSTRSSTWPTARVSSPTSSVLRPGG